MFQSSPVHSDNAVAAELISCGLARISRAPLSLSERPSVISIQAINGILYRAKSGANFGSEPSVAAFNASLGRRAGRSVSSADRRSASVTADAAFMVAARRA